MSTLIRRSIAPLLAAACLSGCGGAPEDRINAAVPVSRDVQVAHDAIAAFGAEHKDIVAAVEGEYASRLKVRALTCAAGYEPSLFSGEEAIKEAVGNADCFEDQDEEIAQWLGLRRLGVLLALPPLREVPKAPAELLPGETGLDKVAFARNAGVAALQWKGHVRVVDAATGDAIRDVDVGLSGGLSISDNGRVFAVGDNDSAAVVQVRDSDSGDMLMTLTDVRGGKVFWLGSQALVYGLSGNGEVAVRDLATGDEEKLPFEAYQLAGALPVPGKAGQYLLFGGRRLGLLELSADKGPKIVKEIAQGDDPYAQLGGGEPAQGPDGNLYFAAGTGVRVLDPATLEDTTIPFDPLRILRVVPTADPDALLLFTQGPMKSQAYLYARKANTLAPVTGGGSDMGGRMLRYVPALRRNAYIESGKVALLATPETGEAQDAGELIDQLAFDAAIARSEQAALREKLMEMYGSNRANTMPRSTQTDFAAEAAARQAEAARKPRTADDIVTDALNRGVLRLGTPSDLDAWKRLYESKSGRKVRSSFDTFARSDKLYVITKEFTMPNEQTGAASATWILERGAPYPRGVGHSAVLDMKSGGCTGRMCSFLLGSE